LDDYDTSNGVHCALKRKGDINMAIWQFILFIICWIPIEHLCIKLEIKINKELFYDLHRKQIERELHKYD